MSARIYAVLTAAAVLRASAAIAAQGGATPPAAPAPPGAPPAVGAGPAPTGAPAGKPSPAVGSAAPSPAGSAATDAELISRYRGGLKYYFPRLTDPQGSAVAGIVVSESRRQAVDARLVVAVLAVEKTLQPLRSTPNGMRLGDRLAQPVIIGLIRELRAAIARGTRPRASSSAPAAAPAPTANPAPAPAAGRPAAKGAPAGAPAARPSGAAPGPAVPTPASTGPAAVRAVSPAGNAPATSPAPTAGVVKVAPATAPGTGAGPAPVAPVASRPVAGPALSESPDTALRKALTLRAVARGHNRTSAAAYAKQVLHVYRQLCGLE